MAYDRVRDVELAPLNEENPSPSSSADNSPSGPTAARGVIEADVALKQCRICLDESGNDFIAPCRCRGSAKWIHRSCLDQWRATNHDKRAFTHCSTCDFQFVVRPDVEDPVARDRADAARLCTFRTRVARDLTLAALAVQGVIVVLALLVYGLDSSAGRLRHAVVPRLGTVWAYYWLGVFLFLAGLGMIGITCWCCGMFDDSGRYGRVYYHHDPCCCYYGCYVGPGDCTACCRTSGGGGGGDSDGGCLAVIVVILVVLAFIGVFVGLYLGGLLVQRIYERHVHVLWLKQEALKWIVQDMDGRDLPAAEPVSVAVHSPAASSSSSSSSSAPPRASAPSWAKFIPPPQPFHRQASSASSAGKQQQQPQQLASAPPLMMTLNYPNNQPYPAQQQLPQQPYYTATAPMQGSLYTTAPLPPHQQQYVQSQPAVYVMAPPPQYQQPQQQQPANEI